MRSVVTAAHRRPRLPWRGAHPLSPAGTSTAPARAGGAESLDDGCEQRVAPRSLFLSLGKVPEHSAAQLGVGEAFEHGVELHRCLRNRLLTEESRLVVETLHLFLELTPGLRSRGGELGSWAKAGDNPLKRDAVAGGMFEDQPAEHGHTDGDQIRDRICSGARRSLSISSYRNSNAPWARASTRSPSLGSEEAVHERGLWCRLRRATAPAPERGPVRPRPRDARLPPGVPLSFRRRVHAAVPPLTWYRYMLRYMLHNVYRNGGGLRCT